MSIELIHGDCLEIVSTLPAQSVDAIITDLPYGTTACKWDTIIPFDDLWRIVKHVLKPRGAFVTTASQPFTSALVMSNPRWFRYEWVWNKTIAANFPNAKYQPLKEHENILVFGFGRGVYNPQRIMRSESSLKRDPIGTIREKGRHNPKKLAYFSDITERRHSTSEDGTRNPSSVIFIKSDHNYKGFEHPTSKPVALLEYLIRTYTNPDDTVLDICAGSYTTGVACVNTGRSFIGIEKEREYYEIGQRRIAEAQAQMRLPLAEAIS